MYLKFLLKFFVKKFFEYNLIKIANQHNMG